MLLINAIPGEALTVALRRGRHEMDQYKLCQTIYLIHVIYDELLTMGPATELSLRTSN